MASSKGSCDSINKTTKEGSAPRLQNQQPLVDGELDLSVELKKLDIIKNNFELTALLMGS